MTASWARTSSNCSDRVDTPRSWGSWGDNSPRPSRRPSRWSSLSRRPRISRFFYSQCCRRRQLCSSLGPLRWSFWSSGRIARPRGSLLYRPPCCRHWGRVEEELTEVQADALQGGGGHFFTGGGGGTTKITERTQWRQVGIQYDGKKIGTKQSLSRTIS